MDDALAPVNTRMNEKFMAELKQISLFITEESNIHSKSILYILRMCQSE
jgi:hypothetical protein